MVTGLCMVMDSLSILLLLVYLLSMSILLLKNSKYSRQCQAIGTSWHVVAISVIFHYNVLGVIRKFAEKCYQIALLLSIAMIIHRYKLPFITSWLK